MIGCVDDRYSPLIDPKDCMPWVSFVSVTYLIGGVVVGVGVDKLA